MVKDPVRLHPVKSFKRKPKARPCDCAVIPFILSQSARVLNGAIKQTLFNSISLHNLLEKVRSLKPKQK